MTQPITPERLAEIREREQAATAGPWGTCYDGKGTYAIQSGCRLSLATGFTSDGDIATLHGEHGDGQTYANADFMARAREDVRDLLAELDRVRAERDDLKNWHDNYVKGTKFAGREIRKRLVAAESESNELKKCLDR